MHTAIWMKIKAVKKSTPTTSLQPLLVCYPEHFGLINPIEGHQQHKNNNMKTIGIIIIAIGILMVAYTGFNYVTTKKVVDLGAIQINKETNHPVQWSPIVGVVLIVGGIVLIIVDRKGNG